MTFEEIQKLIEQVNHSNITKLNLEFDGGHLDIDKRTNEKKSVPVSKNVNEMVIEDKPIASVEQIKAPLVGIVYLQANPKDSQYKKIGDYVKKGDTVCVIESMKTLTEIESEISGTISDILVKNEDVVEYDQPLFTVTK